MNMNSWEEILAIPAVKVLLQVDSPLDYISWVFFALLSFFLVAAPISMLLGQIRLIVEVIQRRRPTQLGHLPKKTRDLLDDSSTELRALRSVLDPRQRVELLERIIDNIQTDDSRLGQSLCKQFRSRLKQERKLARKEKYRLKISAMGDRGKQSYLLPHVQGSA